jgi:hypothetical protein
MQLKPNRFYSNALGHKIYIGSTFHDNLHIFSMADINTIEPEEWGQCTSYHVEGLYYEIESGWPPGWEKDYTLVRLRYAKTK